MEQNFIYDLTGENLFLSLLIVGTLPLVFVVVYALVAILGELKIASWVQDRIGPFRTGLRGAAQPLAEVFKLIQKEDITPDAVDKPLYNLAPFISFMAAYAAFAVIPFSAVFVPSAANVGLFYLIAVGSIAVIAIVMGGWASNNKYSLLGAMRSAAQIVSYEIPAGVAVLAIAALAGTLNIQVMIQEQSGWFWNWFLFGGPGGAVKIIFIPFTAALFFLTIVTALAETNRTPFDIPEGESEIVAGYHTEYSGMKFGMFFFAEYANMFVVSALITILFLGGWNSPFGDFLNQVYLQPVWFLIKSMFFVFLIIQMRWTLPRLRVDQLMYVSWKVLIPISFVCFIAISALALVK